MGKTNESLIKAMQNAPLIEPFTDEEWLILMADIAKDKDEPIFRAISNF